MCHTDNNTQNCEHKTYMKYSNFKILNSLKLSNNTVVHMVMDAKRASATDSTSTASSQEREKMM